MAMTKRAEYTVWVALDEPALNAIYEEGKRPIIVRVGQDSVRVELEPTVQRQGAFTLDLADLQRIVADAAV